MAAMKRWILGAVLVATGCKNAPTQDQCQQLLDHLVDLEFKKAGATSGDAVKSELAKMKQAVSEARSAEFFEICTKKTSRARVECTLAAGDVEGVMRCDDAK